MGHLYQYTFFSIKKRRHIIIANEVPNMQPDLSKHGEIRYLHIYILFV